MMGFLADAGFPIGFGEWMKYGLPLVPLWALIVGAYMYLRCKPNFLVKTVNPSEVVKREVAKLPRFGGNEAVMAAKMITTQAGDFGGRLTPYSYEQNREQIFSVVRRTPFLKDMPDDLLIEWAQYPNSMRCRAVETAGAKP